MLKNSSLAVLSTLSTLLCGAGAAHLAHATPPPSPRETFETYIAVQENCGVYSDSLPGCMKGIYPDGSTIGTKRFVTSASGNVAFKVRLVSFDSGPSWSGPPDDDYPPNGAVAHANFTYLVTVTARGPSGQVVANATSVTIHGAGEHDVVLPLDVEWAESAVSVSVAMFQTACPTQHEQGTTGVLVPACASHSGGTAGADLSGIDLGATLPWTLNKSDFVLLVTPAAAFQSPVVPVGIVYAPLGNQGKSSFSITDTTAVNQSFTDTWGNQTSKIDDDKTSTTWTFAVGMAGMGGNGGETPVTASLGFSFAGSWDHTGELDWGDSEQETGSVLTQSQMNATFSAAPQSVKLSEMTYSTQPFWHDVILAAIDAKYALWSYPTGLVLQPLGNASLAQLDVLQLDACYRDTAAIDPLAAPYLGAPFGGQRQPQTHYPAGSMIVVPGGGIYVTVLGGDTPWHDVPDWSTAPNEGDVVVDGHITWRNETDHFVRYAGAVASGQTQYLWLGSDDCLQLASIDPFYVAKSQSAAPAKYRKLSNGSSVLSNAPTTFTNTDTTTQSVLTAATSTLGLKTTAIGVQSQEMDLGMTVASLLGLKYQNINASTTSFVSTSTSAGTQQTQTTITGTAAASTTIQDNNATPIMLPINVMQDSVWQGIAVQDTDMHFTPPSASGAPENPRRVTIPAGNALPVVEVGGVPPATGSYLQKTNYGYVTVDRAPIE